MDGFSSHGTVNMVTPSVKKQSYKKQKLKLNKNCEDTCNESENLQPDSNALMEVNSQKNISTFDCELNLLKRRNDRSCTINFHKCQSCKKLFTDLIAARNHAQTHVKKGFQCPTCFLFFAKKVELKVHNVQVHNKHLKAALPVRDVDKHGALEIQVFPNEVKRARKKECNNRTLNVLQQTRFECSKCKEKFTCFTDFIKHKKVHSFYGFKPQFKCQYCGKYCKSRYDLRVHERIHTGEKPYKCSQCSAAYAQKGNLNWHMLSAHQDISDPVKSNKFK